MLPRLGLACWGCGDQDKEALLPIVTAILPQGGPFWKGAERWMGFRVTPSSAEVGRGWGFSWFRAGGRQAERGRGSVTVQEHWSAVWRQSCGGKDKVGVTWEPPNAGPRVPLRFLPLVGRAGVWELGTPPRLFRPQQTPSSLGVAPPPEAPCLALFHVRAVSLGLIFSGPHGSTRSSRKLARPVQLSCPGE